MKTIQIIGHHVVALLKRTSISNPARLDAAPQDWLIQHIRTWIANNGEHVHEAMLSRGGWEVWAQLELIFALRPQVGAGDTVDRELDQIWPQSPKDRVDFWFSWSQQDPHQQPSPRWGVELKCRTQAESHDNFNKRLVEGDFTKCNQQPDVGNFGRTIMYAVAISPDPNDINDYDPSIWENTFYTTVSTPNPSYVTWRKVF